MPKYAKQDRRVSQQYAKEFRKVTVLCIIKPTGNPGTHTEEVFHLVGHQLFFYSPFGISHERGCSHHWEPSFSWVEQAWKGLCARISSQISNQVWQRNCLRCRGKATLFRCFRQSKLPFCPEPKAKEVNRKSIN